MFVLFFVFIACTSALPFYTIGKVPIPDNSIDSWPHADLTGKELLTQLKIWVSQQTPEDQANLNAFGAKISKIANNFEAILMEDAHSLSPKLKEALKAEMEILSDPKKGLWQKWAEMDTLVQSGTFLGTLEEKTDYYFKAVMKYLEKHGNPLLGPDSILGKQV